MKCNYKTMATADLEAMAFKRTNELCEIRRELERRKGQNVGPKRQARKVNFDDYLTD